MKTTKAGARNSLEAAIKTVNKTTIDGKPEPKSGETVELTFAAAFTMAKRSGVSLPYNGYGKTLKNGDFLCCRPDGQFVLTPKARTEVTNGR